MKNLIVLKPYGWCFGVESAIKTFINIKNKLSNLKIYVIGDLVHNKQSLDLIKGHNIKFIKTSNAKIILRNINSNKSVIIFPAHGYQKDIFEYAQKKFKYIYNLTCPYILNTISIICKKLNEKRPIYFYGIKQHPETKAILSINSSIKLVSSLKRLSLIKNGYLFNQSTIPKILIEKNLRQKSLKYISTTCGSTNQRHINILNLPSNIDLLLIVGDKKSNNANTLYKLAKLKKINTQLIQTFNQINKRYLNNIKTCAITSSTSTPKKIVDEIINKLSNYGELSNKQ